MSARTKDGGLILGASPRARLLPREVADRKRGASIRRTVVIGLVGAVLISAAGYGLASWQAIQSSIALADAQARTTELIAEQNKFVEVRTLSQLKDSIVDAQLVGGGSEIDWNTYYKAILPTLPDGMILDSFIVNTQTPLQSPPASANPVAEPRVASIVFVVGTSDFGAIATWLRSLESLPGYVDASATSAVASAETSVYAASVTLNIDEGALSNRFVDPAEQTATTTGSTTESSN